MKKIADTKMYPEDLNSPRREFPNEGLGIVVTLLVRPGIIFCVFLIGAQSSCFRSQVFRQKLTSYQRPRNPRWTITQATKDLPDGVVVFGVRRESPSPSNWNELGLLRSI